MTAAGTYQIRCSDCLYIGGEYSFADDVCFTVYRKFLCLFWKKVKTFANAIEAVQYIESVNGTQVENDYGEYY